VDKFLAEWTPRLYRFAIRLTGDVHAAEDLTQEAILRAWRQRATIRSEGALETWIFRIAVNLWRDQVRRLRSPVARPTALPAEMLVDGARPADQILTDREELQRVLVQLDGLPSRQREAIYLSACEGMKTSEIAVALDISVEAVRASLSLARKRLRECFPETMASADQGERVK
jgi:RNA polymerase sigma-70 factor (ECF subfamily)